MKKLLILCAFFMPFFVSAANTPQVNDFTNSSRIYRRQFSLTAGKQYKFRTFSNNNPVLYLLNSSNVQVAMNNNCGSDCLSTQNSNDSTLTYTPTTSGYYYIVMVNNNSGQVGQTANLKQYANGILLSSVNNAPLGGIKQEIPEWSAFSQTTPIFSYRKLFFYYFNTDKEANGGSFVADNVLYLVSNNAVVAYDDDGGAGFTSKITMTSGSCSSGCFILGGAHTSTPDTEGNARLIVDPYTNFGDSDFDGLSNALESILGTNSTKRDSDGDGLNDYLETVGSGNIELPWEGSSPTQKDVFLEVDYFGREIDSNWVFFFDAHQNYIKTQLANSFDRYGNIRLHIDVDDYLGEMSDTANIRGALCAAGDFIQSDNQNWTINNFYNLENKKSVDFTSYREGIYYWIVAANRHTKKKNTSSGLSCVNLSTGVGSDKLIISLGTWSGGGTQEQYTGTTMHELGHNFMLTHNGNGNDNYAGPNSIIHRSVMNYRYQTSGVPRNVTLYFPPNIIPDSIWRYSTDNSSNRTDLEWLAQYGGQGCIKADEVSQSPKQACMIQNAQPTCDCTFDEWTVLDLNSVGTIGAGSDENRNMDGNSPIFGLNGVILAENLDDLMNSGAKYTKITTKAEKIEYLSRKQEVMNNYYTPERKADLREKYLQYLEERGFVEGDDYKIINGNIVFE
ncbi:pre-peptidase C-terminal domain-containing protein [bacterium]|nr:pre-peptidase C-terminal domain-containing protein [bacterium]